MDRRGALTVVGGAIAALLLVMVASSDPVPLAERAPSLPFDLPTLEFSDVDIETPDDQSNDDAEQSEPRDLPDDVRRYLTSLLLIGLIALVAWGTKNLWRHRPDLIWRPTPQRDDFGVLEEIAEAVTADAAAQRAALERGEARNAIVACWSRLEHLVGDVGFERDPADTAAEFTERVLSRYPVDPAAIAGLAALYREARFSTHPMGEAERGAAIEALDEIHAGLRATTDTSVTT